MMEKLKDIKDLVFPHLCLVGVEKWRNRKLFCLVKKKMRG